MFQKSPFGRLIHKKGILFTAYFNFTFPQPLTILPRYIQLFDGIIRAFNCIICTYEVVFVIAEYKFCYNWLYFIFLALFFVGMSHLVVINGCAHVQILRRNHEPQVKVIPAAIYRFEEPEFHVGFFFCCRSLHFQGEFCVRWNYHHKPAFGVQHQHDVGVDVVHGVVRLHGGLCLPQHASWVILPCPEHEEYLVTLRGHARGDGFFVSIVEYPIALALHEFAATNGCIICPQLLLVID